MDQKQSGVVTHDPVEWVRKNARTLDDIRLARLSLSPHAEAVREIASEELARRARHGRRSGTEPIHREAVA